MKLTGCVINSNTYKDNDLIVDLLTSEGVKTFKSKGIKKIEAKNKSLIFDFSFIEAEFLEKSNKIILINGKNLINTNILYSSYAGLVFVNYLKEAIYKIMLIEERQLLYEDLKNALLIIESDGSDLNIYSCLITLLIKILQISGYDPFYYFENIGILELLEAFTSFNFKALNLDINQTINILKKVTYYIEETVDLKINSFELFKHL